MFSTGFPSESVLLNHDLIKKIRESSEMDMLGMMLSKRHEGIYETHSWCLQHISRQINTVENWKKELVEDPEKAGRPIHGIKVDEKGFDFALKVLEELQRNFQNKSTVYK